MSAPQANDLLTAAYMAEVESRRMKFRDDEDVRRNIRSVSDFITSESPSFGLMLCGTCGNGKTTMLHAIQNAMGYLGECTEFRWERKPFLSVADAREVLRLAKDYDRFRDLCRRPMLAIEDAGREATEVMDYGNVLNPVVELLEYRYESQLFTVLTTNLTASQFSEKYGKRIADRMNEMMTVIVFRQGSYRV